MKFRAYIKNEGVGECTWFVYVENGQGRTMACRFGRAEHAQAVADKMNDAWRVEGRYYIPEPVD